MSGERIAITHAPVTAADLAALRDDDHRYDLVRGELWRMAPAGFRHGAIAGAAAQFLRDFASKHDLGVVLGAETGFRLARDPDTVLAPDAAFVRRDRLPPPDQRAGFPDLAPDLVVEVVSPSDRADQVNEKVVSYLDAGVPLVWVVYPDTRTVAVHAPDGTVRLMREADELDGGDVLPGMRLPVADLLG